MTRYIVSHKEYRDVLINDIGVHIFVNKWHRDHRLTNIEFPSVEEAVIWLVKTIKGAPAKIIIKD